MQHDCYHWRISLRKCTGIKPQDPILATNDLISHMRGLLGGLLLLHTSIRIIKLGIKDGERKYEEASN